MKKTPLLIICICFLGLHLSLSAQETTKHYLSGIDKDHTKDWDFYCTKGRNSGKWTKIPVPSNWEQFGFGSYNYGHDKSKSDEQGLYKYTFKADKEWKDKDATIVFEASMTDTEVKINGKSAGAIHQGAFYRFKYNISKLLKYGEDNLLEVTVSKMSSDSSVNNAERNGDFWVFGGIFRPVYIEISPKAHIDRVAIDAKADGTFSMEVFPVNVKGEYLIEAQVQKLNGENVGKALQEKASTKQEKTILSGQFDHPDLWTQEFPNLYQVVVTLKKDNSIVHAVTQRFGFRTMELRLRDGVYVNGEKVIFRGVNRHSLWPETARTLSKEISLMDINLMKEMNVNAVRMSHYPPDQHFLDYCDSLGLFVLDELTGWEAIYNTEVGRKLVKELVVRDVNHPSILFWDNGNEGGWNTKLDGDYEKYDPQKRIVIHPWEKFNGTDTKHYPTYNFLVNSTLYGQDVFFPTEFMHGLYDGGHGAGLDDFWALMLKHPHCAGGFLWAFHDEGIVRTDKNGIIDTDKNHAPDGIVGPHREKEASFYTIKEIWSPVYIDKRYITYPFNGKIEVENRYISTNLNQCSFEWKLVSFATPADKTSEPKINATGKPQSPSIAPGERGYLDLNLPSSWKDNDALYLTAYDRHKNELFTWTWPLKSPTKFLPLLPTQSKSKVETSEKENSLIIQLDGIVYYFNKTTGYIEKVINSKSEISLSEGPVLAGADQTLKLFNHRKDGERYIVEPIYQGKSRFNVKWIFTPGELVKLEYSYSARGESDFFGITFNYPENKITGMKWLGRGPFRVWKNRLKGLKFGVWEKDYNNSITGESFIYPEFKGYHSELYWVRVENKESSFTVYSENEGIFLQMFEPEKPTGAFNSNTTPTFPKGNIGFLNAISPIGTKFQEANLMGPQSQKSVIPSFKGSLLFDFR